MKPYRFSLGWLLSLPIWFALLFGLFRFAQWHIGYTSWASLIIFSCVLFASISEPPVRRGLLVFAVSAYMYLMAFDVWLRHWRFRGQSIEEVSYLVVVDRLWEIHWIGAFVFAAIMTAAFAVGYAVLRRRREPENDQP